MNKNDNETNARPTVRPVLKLLQETEMREIEGGKDLLGPGVTSGSGTIGSRLIEYKGCSWTWTPFRG